MTPRCSVTELQTTVANLQESMPDECSRKRTSHDSSSVHKTQRYTHPRNLLQGLQLVAVRVEPQQQSTTALPYTQKKSFRKNANILRCTMTKIISLFTNQGKLSGLQAVLVAAPGMLQQALVLLHVCPPKLLVSLLHHEVLLAPCTN